MLVFEDLHWIDSETQSLLDSLVASLPTARLLLLVNYRPEYQHSWGSKTSYTQLRLDPLPTVSVDGVCCAPCSATTPPRPRPLLMAQTKGNPFFLEESVRTLVETGLGRRAWDLLPGTNPADHPSTSHSAQAVLAAPPCGAGLPTRPRSLVFQGTGLHGGIAFSSASGHCPNWPSGQSPGCICTGTIPNRSSASTGRRLRQLSSYWSGGGCCTPALLGEWRRTRRGAGGRPGRPPWRTMPCGARWDRPSRTAHAGARAGGPRGVPRGGGPLRAPWAWRTCPGNRRPGSGHRLPLAAGAPARRPLGGWAAPGLVPRCEAKALARAVDDRARLGRVLAGMARMLRITGDHGVA